MNGRGGVVTDAAPEDGCVTLTPPLVLSSSELPLAELCAARLEGELFDLAGGFCPPDTPVTSSTRAAAVAAGRPARLIAELHTAAWIHGVQPEEPAVPQFCTSTAHRVKASPSRLEVRLREVVIDDDELVLLGGRQVTAPLRTAVDLARSAELFDGRVSLVVLKLLRLGAHTLDDCVEQLDRRRNLPGKRRSLRRLQALLTR